MGGRGSNYSNVSKGGKLFQMSKDRPLSQISSSKRFPAEANTQIKTKTPEGALKQFSKNYKNSDHEYLYEVDKNGFVHQFNEGAAHSVSFTSTRYTDKGQMSILHNHPSGGNLSPQDLKNFASEKQKSVSAVGSTRTYTVTKGTHFNSAGFLKGLATAKASSNNYTKSADKWLKENQKKYGYTYTNKPTK